MSGATFLPCPKCGASSGEPCQRLDGTGERSRSHVFRRKVATCGTPGGYQRHRKAGEPACEPCRAAQAGYIRQYRTDPEVREQTLRENAARTKALWALARRYPNDYRELVREASASTEQQLRSTA